MLFLIEVWRKSEKVENMVLIFATSRFDLFSWLNKNVKREEEFFGWGFNCYLKWFSHCIVQYYELSSRSTNFLSYFISTNIIHRWDFIVSKYSTFNIIWGVMTQILCVRCSVGLTFELDYYYPKYIDIQR